MAKGKTIEVGQECYGSIKQYAEEKGVEVGEAAEMLISTAVGRLTAVRKYAKANRKEKPAKAKVTKIEKAKAGKGKAKGPLARKTAKPAKEKKAA